MLTTSSSSPRLNTCIGVDLSSCPCGVEDEAKELMTAFLPEVLFKEAPPKGKLKIFQSVELIMLIQNASMWNSEKQASSFFRN